jgi:hypothetical protein
MALWLEKKSDIKVLPSQWNLDRLAELGITPEIASLFVIFVGRYERIYLGHRAIAQSLLRMGGVLRLLGKILSIQKLDPIWIALYRLLAQNRHRLPGGTPMCAAQINMSSANNEIAKDI